MNRKIYCGSGRMEIDRGCHKRSLGPRILSHNNRHLSVSHKAGKSKNNIEGDDGNNEREDGSPPSQYICCVREARSEPHCG